jgi:hypothetical protein
LIKIKSETTKPRTTKPRTTKPRTTKQRTTKPVPFLIETIKPKPIYTPLFCTLFENKSKNQINLTDSTDSTLWLSVSVLSFYTLDSVVYDEANYDITENEEIHIANVEFPPGYSYSTLDKKMDLWVK